MKPTFAITLTISLLLAAPAVRADVKTGVDAWNQGDYGRAVNEWRPLAIAGNPDAQFNLGQAYKLGRGVPVDLPVALEWFRKASEQGHEKAADNYGLLLFQQGRQEDAMPYIKASSSRGEPRAQYLYATALFNGDLVQRDWVQAYALMTRASQAGISQASQSLAQMDQYLSDAQRREGTTLAGLMTNGPRPAAAPPAVSSGQRAQASPVPTALPAPARPASTPGSNAQVPTPQPTARKPETPVPLPAKSAPTTSAAPAPVPPGSWRVQLGAFREEGRAEALWRSLGGKVPGLSSLQPFYVPTNGLTRLLVGPLAGADSAQQLCARIKPTGTPCMVVKP